MATLHLPDDLKALAESRAADAGFATVEDYMQALIRADAQQDLSPELEASLLEGLDSGPTLAVTPQFWDDLKRRTQPSRP